MLGFTVNEIDDSLHEWKSDCIQMTRILFVSKWLVISAGKLLTMKVNSGYCVKTEPINGLWIGVKVNLDGRRQTAQGNRYSH